MITIDHGNIKTLGKHRSNDGVFPVASTNFGVPTEIPRRPGFQPWQVTMPLSDGRIWMPEKGMAQCMVCHDAFVARFCLPHQLITSTNSSSGFMKPITSGHGD
jgi:hypothetical protein